MQFKEIHYDSIITEFGFEKSLHIHIKAGKKLKDIKKIESILDKHIKANFYQEIAPTGEFIQQELAKLDFNKADLDHIHNLNERIEKTLDPADAKLLERYMKRLRENDLDI